MESETFQALCHAAGTVLGIDPPAVTYDEQGTALLSLRLNDVAITLAHQSDRCPEAALAFVDLGPPPWQLEHEAWLSLMDTNFLMGGDGTVSFACNPEGDEAILQCAYPLATVTGEGLVDSLGALAMLARRWQRDHFLGGDTDTPGWHAGRSASVASSHLA